MLRHTLALDSGQDLRLEFRSWRWVAHLPDDLIAYAAVSEEGVARLSRARTILDTLTERVSFSVPLVEHVSADGSVQLCRMVPGIQLGGDGRERRFAQSPLGPRLASDLGSAFAELYAAMRPSEAASLGVPRGDFVAFGRGLDRRLSNYDLEPAVRHGLDIVLNACRGVAPRHADLAFTHCDPWGGNFAVNPTTGALNGLFDFDDANIDDRNTDLRYLFSFGEDFVARALTTYADVSVANPTKE